MLQLPSNIAWQTLKATSLTLTPVLNKKAPTVGTFNDEVVMTLCHKKGHTVCL